MTWNDSALGISSSTVSLAVLMMWRRTAPWRAMRRYEKNGKLCSWATSMKSRALLSGMYIVLNGSYLACSVARCCTMLHDVARDVWMDVGFSWLFRITEIHGVPPLTTPKQLVAKGREGPLCCDHSSVSGSSETLGGWPLPILQAFGDDLAPTAALDSSMLYRSV